MTFAPHRRFPRRSRNHSFTLVELLTVIAIIVILAAASLPALTSISSERDLSNSANTIWNMADLARSEAISRSTVVRLCIATGPAAPANDTPPYRALSLWAYDQASAGYIQISKWEHLPNSVEIDANADPYTFYTATASSGYPGIHIANTAALSNTTNNVPLNGQTVTADYLQFQPNGGVTLPSSLGFATNLYIFVLKASKVSATAPATPLKDWRIVQIGSLAGQTKVIAP